LLKEFVNVTNQMVYPWRKLFAFLSSRGTIDPRKKLLKTKSTIFVDMFEVMDDNDSSVVFNLCQSFKL